MVRPRLGKEKSLGRRRLGPVRQNQRRLLRTRRNATMLFYGTTKFRFYFWNMAIFDRCYFPNMMIFDITGSIISKEKDSFKSRPRPAANLLSPLLFKFWIWSLLSMAVGREDKGKETASDEEDEEWLSSESDGESLEEEEEEEEDEDSASEWCNTGLVAELGNGGVILVLFETPSGFAIFAYDGIKLYEPDAYESIWGDFVNGYAAKRAAVLLDFRTFEDKVNAINQHGVSQVLAEMISKHIQPNIKLAVANQEYQKIIEEQVGISCMCPPFVEELMWGLKIQMRSLVPAETSEFFHEGQLPMCLGMRSFLNGFGCGIEPNMPVTRRIIEMAGFIFECQFCVNRHSGTLRRGAVYLKEISDIDTESWDLLKLVTAFKIILFPKEKVAFPRWLFKSHELERMKQDAPQYEYKLFSLPCLEIHGEVLRLRRERTKVWERLMPLIERAKNSYKDKHTCEATSSHEIDVKKIHPGINNNIIDELKDYDSMVSSKCMKRQVYFLLCMITLKG